MKASTVLLGFALSTMPAIAQFPGVADLAKNAIKSLPRGCIVTAEQTGTEAPTIALTGQHEPAQVPPEKIIFEIGSISKVFTGILLAQTVSEKKLTLETTLHEAMGPKQKFSDENVANITLLQLATHTSGLPRMPEPPANADPGDPFALYDRHMLNGTIAKMKLDHAAPFAFSYSNLGVGLLADLIARLHGKEWEDLVIERICKPLGMNDTRITLNNEQQTRLAPPYAGDRSAKHLHLIAMAGAGALRSTAADMLLFGQALANPDATPLKDAIRMIEEPRADGKTGLCLGIKNLNGQISYWFQGGTNGFGSWISARPSNDHIVVMLINNNAMMPQDVLFGAAKKAPGAAPAPPPAPEDATLADYVGVYDTDVDSPRGRIYYTFEGRGHDLWHQITGQPFRQLTKHPSTADRFEIKAFNAELQFTRENGKVTSVTLYQSGFEIKAKKL